LIIALLIILLSSPTLYGSDLSKYRTFSLGTSLANLSKEIDEGPIDATNQNMNEKSRHSVAS
jgi:hypothetical protein